MVAAAAQLATQKQHKRYSQHCIGGKEYWRIHATTPERRTSCDYFCTTIKLQTKIRALLFTVLIALFLHILASKHHNKLTILTLNLMQLLVFYCLRA
jgi:hypothetical protein